MISAVGLSNFMSYKNSLVTLRPGLNLICGPNGAGKSSILLAISLVLGLTYTERGRKLSDLIRWGEEEARVSLHLSNESVEGHRPFPEIKKETVTVTRALRKNGSYYFLFEGRPVTKEELTGRFRSIGLNPENMLIIMHQLMVTRFASVSVQEKLQMLEEAVGFKEYRERVLLADERLSLVSREQNSLENVLDSTKETYEYWRREYEKYRQKKVFEAKLNDLKRELAWAKVGRFEASVQRVRDRIERQTLLVKQLDSRIVDARGNVSNSEKNFKEIGGDLERLRQAELKLAEARGAISAGLELWGKLIPSPGDYPQLSLTESESSHDLSLTWRTFEGRLRELYSQVPGLDDKLRGLHNERQALSDKVEENRKKLEEGVLSLISSNVEKSVLEFKRQTSLEQLEELRSQAKILEEDLQPLLTEAQQLGDRLKVEKRIQEIMNDIARVEEQIKPLAHLTEEVEKQFVSYESVYRGLREKAEALARNREEILKELKVRFEKWNSIMESLLTELSKVFASLLAEVDGTGVLKLLSRGNIRDAGIELSAGFRGALPTPLDTLSQSGGERSVALMAFLLSLQSYIKSPFRAIDEFDVHLDPKNRETITRLIVSSVRNNPAGQYLAITPGELHIPDGQDLNVIVVQNTAGQSTVKEMRTAESKSKAN